MDDGRFRIRIRLACPGAEEARRRARAIALEQTVELPESCVPPQVLRTVVGAVERVASRDDGAHDAWISFTADAVGPEIPQLLNLLFGNASLLRGVRIEHVDWPDSWLRHFDGPRHGVEGVRRLCGVEWRRPLLCVAIKPLGLAAADLARLCGSFARAGIDLLKDDHGLADQPFAPFRERVARCAEAVARANAAGGGSTLYVPNATGPLSTLVDRLEAARAEGIRAVLLSPWIVGPDTVRSVAARTGMAIVAHPSMTGAYFHPEHGIAPGVLLGDLFRILGCDAVIYPGAGGRFPLEDAACRAIERRLRGPLGSLAPAFPMPGGGLRADRVREWIATYGTDTIFLVGGSLYAAPDPARAGEDLMRAIEENSR